MPGNVDLQLDKYAFLKENARKRSEAMIGYASEDSLCRSRFLLKYFGQEESDDCGTCDVCRAHAGNDAIRQKILKFYEDNPSADLKAFKAFLADPANGMPANSVSVYRRMLDEGEL